MNRKKKAGSVRRIASLIMVLVIAAAYMPQFGGAAFAEELQTDLMEETRAFLVNDDGTQTEISGEELEELREGSMTELPEVIDVVVDGGDTEWVDAADELMDGGSAEFSTEGEAVDLAAENETNDVEAVSEAGQNETDGSQNAADPEGLIFDETADDTQETESGDAAGPGDFSWDGGNAEHMDIPALLGREIDLTADLGQSLDNGSFEIGGKQLDAGSASSISGVVGSGYYNIDISQSGSVVTVSGSIQAPYSFYGLFVDTTLVKAVTGYSVSAQINMNSFATGYHTVSLGVVENNGTTLVDAVGRKYMESNTLETPGYNGVFTVYSNYLTYYPYNMALQNQAHDLYMEYSSNGGKTWTRSGYMRANMIQLYISQAYTISGLKPKTKYRTRIHYGTFVTYSKNYAGDGQSHFFAGPRLNTTTIKTGDAKKPKIKSITAKAVNVKYHQIRHYGKYTGVYLYTERFYTCKIKVTVKLKKKPGTKGLWINGKWVKGNKKTYTKTFSPYPNYYAKHPRGHYKFAVTVCSGQSGSWGGYSPSISKNKKLS